MPSGCLLSTPSPDKDFGYDISDYTAVDRRFGTLEDFDRLVEGAHRRGIRVVLDMVLNHTSDQHPWFQESRCSRTDPRRDWYIWRDQPNNWQAVFGGPAWQHDPLTGQYYLHLFTTEQPDVNWHNPQVRQALLDVFRFWLARGTDGFRLDVFNAYFKHPALLDNPTKLGLMGFQRQRHLYDIDQPEMMPLLNELRSLLDAYPESYAVGETFLATPEKTVSYCGPDKLHAAFSFDFTASNLVFPWKASWVKDKILSREKIFDAAGVWPTTVMSNHDLKRARQPLRKGRNRYPGLHRHDPPADPARHAFLVLRRGDRHARHFIEAQRNHGPARQEVLASLQGARWLPRPHAVGRLAQRRLLQRPALAAGAP